MAGENKQFLTVAADGVICADPCVIYHAHLTAGADAANAILYNNASAASGTVIVELGAVATAGDYVEMGVYCSNGIYADVTGTAPSLTVVFKRV